MRNTMRSALARFSVKRIWAFFLGFLGASLVCIICIKDSKEVNLIPSFLINGEKEQIKEEPKCPIEEFSSFGQILRYFEDSTNQLCEKLTTAGGEKVFGFLLTDGHKWICPYWPWLIEDNCTVYSFGINKDWTFDDEMDRKYRCKVYSFDPTNGMETHNRTKSISFYSLGISNITGTKTLGKKDNCKVSRMSDIRKMLNHEKERIDILKMDVEGSELETFEDILNNSPEMLTKYVSQIAMEIHLGRVNATNATEKWSKYWTLLQNLECLGFRLTHWEANMGAETYFTQDHYKFKCCYELLYLNKNML